MALRVGLVGVLLAVAGQAAAAPGPLVEPLRLVPAVSSASSVSLPAPALAAVPTAPLRLGVTPGPRAEIFAEVKRVAAARGLPLDIVVFDDATRIDAALAAGRLDAASFEDARQLAAARRAHGYALGNVATTVTLPLALYSRRLTGLNQLQPGARVVIPAEPRAAARALVLLQNETLLTLRDGAGLDATPHDVTGNRLGLRIVTRPARQLFAALDAAALVAMDRETAARAGLQPGRDSIGIEDARSPFADVLAVRDADRARPWVRELIAACHSDEIAHFILVRYQDSVRRPW
ncbi:putative NLPA lipoprotein [Burkholderia plantarii]|uniref:Putative NLPA lipoprotein n=1 Tax=Burkholderia plantarii TaxID=41899 RepID=A0A0B6RVZ0_BURPL|nr:putative NLPA lipoprotein [Burkholderia plantarii]